ncbi:MAG: Flp family type IVb pilin [Deltaproteobacteria bacterium]|nr:Flp family type IVb pilin [Deltaproteobacteria bacterium]MBW2167009.1 Flp family type IVb pilin [Deltaproteobacteria bacterium]MBW2740870.1 Flp family type IVb pilin [Deltaproteobacteria bacterium]
MRSESGVTAVEYTFIIALIAIVIIAMVCLVGEELSEVFQQNFIVVDQHPPEPRPPEVP